MTDGNRTSIVYFDPRGEVLPDSTGAVRCVIREEDKDGNLIMETWGSCSPVPQAVTHDAR